MSMARRTLCSTVRTAITLALALPAFALPVAAIAADPATLAEVQAADGKRLSRDEVLALVTGSRAESTGRTGSDRQLDHGKDGRMTGRSYGANQRSGGTAAEGTWRVNDNGAYCVDLNWKGATVNVDEKWCGGLWKVGGAYYVVLGSTPDARAWKHAFVK